MASDRRHGNGDEQKSGFRNGVVQNVGRIGVAVTLGLAPQPVTHETPHQATHDNKSRTTLVVDAAGRPAADAKSGADLARDPEPRPTAGDHLIDGYSAGRGQPHDASYSPGGYEGPTVQDRSIGEYSAPPGKSGSGEEQRQAAETIADGIREMEQSKVEETANKEEGDEVFENAQEVKKREERTGEEISDIDS